MSLGLAFLAQPALAQSQAEDCGARGPDIIAAIHPQATQLEPLRYEIDGKIATLASIVGGPYDMICRDWPAYPDRLLVGLPLIHGADAADDPDKTGDLEILVLDRASYAPQARLLLSDFIQ
ncbi:MAG: hypothetical protein Q4G26_13295, partial [Paracoccus sp. (in: a-proteobacteria)]|nr:hypothetical protein [Paracoccus sp. (in: a-proteobacteria)]